MHVGVSFITFRYHKLEALHVVYNITATYSVSSLWHSVPGRYIRLSLTWQGLRNDEMLSAEGYDFVPFPAEPLLYALRVHDDETKCLDELR